MGEAGTHWMKYWPVLVLALSGIGGGVAVWQRIITNELQAQNHVISYQENSARIWRMLRTLIAATDSNEDVSGDLEKRSTELQAALVLEVSKLRAEMEANGDLRQERLNQILRLLEANEKEN